MLVKLSKLRLNKLISDIKFDPYDPFYAVLLDENTSFDYCITKAIEELHHLRSGRTNHVQGLIVIARILLIAYHKVKQ